MNRTVDTLGNDTVDVVFDSLGLQLRVVIVEGDGAVLSGSMQIVTSTSEISAHVLSSRVSCEVSG